MSGLASAQKANRARIADKVAGVGLPDIVDLAETPDQRRERLRALGGAPRPENGEDTGASARKSAPKAKKPSASASAKRPATLSALDPYTRRAESGTGGGSKINVGLSQARAEQLDALERAVFTATGRSLNRATLVTEAARRVAARPTTYAAISGGGASAGDPPPLGARIPAEVYRSLRAATYMAQPRLQYGPLVSNALIELVVELTDAVTHARTDKVTQ